MTRSQDWLNDNRGGGDTYDGVEFPTIGSGARGKVMEPAFVAVTQFGERLCINLQTADGPRTWWVKPGPQAQALSKGLADAGAADVETGADMAVAMTGEKDTGKGNPMKLYEVRYKSPAGQAPQSGTEPDLFAGLG